MIMKDPVHPGEIVRELFLEPMGITVTEAAKHLGVGRGTLSNLINEKSSISPEMAIRLSKAFSNSLEFWMNLQKQYETSQANMMSKKIKVAPFDKAA